MSAISWASAALYLPRRVEFLFYLPRNDRLILPYQDRDFTYFLSDLFSHQKYGDMQDFVQRLKAMGYERVELVDTTNGLFMSRWEATWMALTGSAILVGKK